MLTNTEIALQMIRDKRKKENEAAELLSLRAEIGSIRTKNQTLARLLEGEREIVEALMDMDQTARDWVAKFRAALYVETVE